MIDKTS